MVPRRGTSEGKPCSHLPTENPARGTEGRCLPREAVALPPTSFSGQGPLPSPTVGGAQPWRQPCCGRGAVHRDDEGPQGHKLIHLPHQSLEERRKTPHTTERPMGRALLQASALRLTAGTRWLGWTAGLGKEGLRQPRARASPQRSALCKSGLPLWSFGPLPLGAPAASTELPRYLTIPLSRSHPSAHL